MSSLLGLAAGLPVIAACGESSSDAPSATSTPVAPEAQTVGLTPSPSPTAPDEMDMLRQMAFGYWEVFNSYDADGVLSFLEVSYGLQRENEIRRDIGRLKRFRIKLGITEESAPRMIGPGEAEMYLRMKEPLGTRRIRMAFKNVDSEWKIAYSQEVK